MHYLAYGSNLHPLRLLLRVPNSRLVGTTKLDGCRLTFNKRSSDGSSKCNLHVTNDPSDIVYAAVFDIPENEISLLDAVEGLGKGYSKQQMTVTVNDSPILVFVYIASSTHLTSELEPYHWYKSFVLAGARKHGFPDSYINEISMIISKHDPDEKRRKENENLLAQLQG